MAKAEIGNEEAGDQEGFKKNLRDFAEEVLRGRLRYRKSAISTTPIGGRAASKVYNPPIFVAVDDPPILMEVADPPIFVAENR